MTDRDWLRAIARYSTDENREWLKGGAVELSRAQEQATKTDGARFAQLALKFDEETNDHYAEAVLRGLGDLSNEVPPELLFDVIRHFYDLPGKPGGRWLAKPLAKVADQTIPDDVLDIVAWYATEHPDPQRDLWRPESEDDVERYGGDPFTAGDNSVRGVGSEALSALIWPNAARVDRLRAALGAVVRDRTIAVRTCAAIALQSTARHDQTLALDLFLELVDADDILLAARPVEDFLSFMAGSHLARLKLVLERMVSSSLSAVREAGGRQAALAALSDKGAEDLVRAALGSDVSARKGVATVAAFNVRRHEVGPRCEAWLVPLFDDDEREVREAAAAWTDSSASTPATEPQLVSGRPIMKRRQVAAALASPQTLGVSPCAPAGPPPLRTATMATVSSAIPTQSAKGLAEAGNSRRGSIDGSIRAQPRATGGR